MRTSAIRSSRLIAGVLSKKSNSFYDSATGMIKSCRLQRNALFHLDAGRGRILQRFEICDGKTDVVQELVCHIAAESLFAKDTHDDDLLDVGRHCVSRYHPSALGEFVLKIKQCPFCSLLIFGLHKPYGDRVGNVFAIVLERSHFSYFFMKILADGNRIVLYGLVAFEA